MSRIPLRILLWAEEPCQASYLETVLEMEAPGLATLTQCGDAAALRAHAAGCDLVLLALAGDAHADPHAQAHPAGRLAIHALGTPVIVVSPWLPGFSEVHEVMRLGAEDVLGLAELSPRRLVAAIVKAVERQTRRQAPQAPQAPQASRAPARKPLWAEVEHQAHTPRVPASVLGPLVADSAAPAC